jgi:hypothetical protein
MLSLPSCTDRIRAVTFLAARCAHEHWQRCLRCLPPFRAINGNVAVPSGGQLKVPPLGLIISCSGRWARWYVLADVTMLIAHHFPELRREARTWPRGQAPRVSGVLCPGRVPGSEHDRPACNPGCICVQRACSGPVTGVNRPGWPGRLKNLVGRYGHHDPRAAHRQGHGAENQRTAVVFRPALLGPQPARAPD